MSRAWISLSDADCPNPKAPLGSSADKLGRMFPKAATTRRRPDARRLHVSVRDLAMPFDFPLVNGLVVIDRTGVTSMDEVLPRRLDRLGLVMTSAPEKDLLSLPAPAEPKSGVTCLQDRLLKPCVLSRSAAIHTRLDRRHTSLSAPGQSADLAKTGVHPLPPEKDASCSDLTPFGGRHPHSRSRSLAPRCRERQSSRVPRVRLHFQSETGCAYHGPSSRRRP